MRLGLREGTGGVLPYLFDPTCRLNPGKVLPTGKRCLEIRQPAFAAGANPKTMEIWVPRA
jgi:hypothetical protein